MKTDQKGQKGLKLQNKMVEYIHKTKTIMSSIKQKYSDNG